MRRRFAVLLLWGPLLWGLGAGVGSAQVPSVAAGVNAGSFADTRLDNGKLARGGIATIFGTFLGPAQVGIATAFPLPTNLNGTSVQIITGGQTFDCLVIVTSATQVSVIIPSAVPAGPAELQATFNGRVGVPRAVEIVDRSVGVFTLTQSGTGPGVFTDPAFVANTLTNSFQPGTFVSAWVTGLGPVAGDEAGGPLPGDMTGVAVEVFVNDVPANVVYRGRSGCCAGLDQIVFELPAGVTGCYAVVRIIVNGLAANPTSISIAESGRYCSDPRGFSAPALRAASERGAVRFGFVQIGRNFGFGPLEAGDPRDQRLRTDNITAFFGEAPFGLAERTRVLEFAVGNSAGNGCRIVQFDGDVPLLDDVGFEGMSVPLQAGPSIAATNQDGQTMLAPLDPGFGDYEWFSDDLELGPAGEGADFFETGRHRVNGPGGAQVGPFEAEVELGPTPIWTNEADIENVSKAQGLRLTWDLGAAASTPGRTWARIFGAAGLDRGTAFICEIDATKGEFTVRPDVLATLETTPNGADALLALVFASDRRRFEAVGIDMGVALETAIYFKRVTYR